MGFHKTVSIIKSLIRVLSCFIVCWYSEDRTLIVFALGFFVAELLGIIEEIKENN